MLQRSRYVLVHGRLHAAIKSALVIVACCLSGNILRSQNQTGPASNLTGRSITAIGYQVGGGSTKVDLKNTGLITQVDGQAKVEAKPGITMVETKIQGLTSPTRLGAEFLTYVL